MGVAARTFSSRRAIAPMMWTLLAIASCELAVVHFLIALWSHAAALAVSLVTLPALVWLVRGIRSLATMPSLVGEGVLVLRAGRMKGVTVPLTDVAGLRGVASAAEAKAPGVLNLAMIAHPNVLVDLVRPVERRGRAYRTLAHRLDDPAAFADALATLGEGND